MNNCIDCNKIITKGSKLGRCASCSHKGKLNNMFGKKRIKLSLNYKGQGNPHYKNGKYCRENKICIDCGKEISYSAIRCCACHIKYLYKLNPNFNKGIYHPNYGLVGELSSNWIDGRSYESYPLEFNDKLKESIRKRDNYICQNCEMTEEEHLIVIGTLLNIHHIDYNKKNCEKDNLITTCRQCNLRANLNRNYWKSFYSEKILIKVHD